MKSKYDWYEIVRVSDSITGKKAEKAGQEGWVSGKSRDLRTGEWFYSVMIGDINYFLAESELEFTGKKIDKTSMESNLHIRVNLKGESVDMYFGDSESK